MSAPLSTRVPRALAVPIIAVVALSVGVASSATGTAATSTKPYRVVVAPAMVAGGSSTTFMATITNESANQVLGSANITAPAGLSVQPTGVTVSPSSSSTSATVVGNVIQLRALGIAPGTNATVMFVATAPCADLTSAWQVEAKQSNNFNGPPGNSFVLDATSELSLTVEGSCHLNFATQPADAVKATTITTTPLNTPPADGTIDVEVLDGHNQRVTTSTAAITVAIGGSSPNPAPGAGLSGTTTRTAVAGVASFDNLAISQHGTYTLSASASGFAPAESMSFFIWDQATTCTGGPCSVGVSQPKSVSAQITSTTATSGALVASLGADSIDCGDPYNHAPATTTFNAYGLAASGVKTATLQIHKSVVQAEPNNGASFYRVCYEAPTPFIDASGALVTLGLLPDCSAVGNVAPCQVSVTKTKAGDVLETISLPAGDPRFR